MNKRRKGFTQGVSYALGCFLGITLIAISGCNGAREQDDLNARNYVKAGDPTLTREIGNAGVRYAVLGQSAFQSKLKSGEIAADQSQAGDLALSRLEMTRGVNSSSVLPVSPPDIDVPADSLVFGLPFELLGKPMTFGNVITEVSDSVKQDLGGLKLTDVPPFQVLPTLQKVNGKYFLALNNCEEDCTKMADAQAVLQIPVLGVNSAKKVIFLNLASLGQELDLMAIYKDHPTLMQFKARSSKVTKFDFSQSTLVFDVEAHLVDVNDSENPAAKETVITNRWYMRVGSGFNPTFVSRKPVDEVGFFTTDRSKEPLIARWDFDRRSAEAGIKYYVKNVPIQFQAAFKGAFEEWNERLLPILGKKVFSYEFISPDDARNELLIAGDVRYNILEWDLKNRANYGGLGPSLANQYTGETFQATVLIQGPTIIEMYSKWFKAHEAAERLRAVGLNQEADLILAKNSREIKKAMDGIGNQTFEVRLGKTIQMNVRSQQPTLEDPLMARDDFEIIPDGYTFDSYMNGYFSDMVKHELGHNLGLRHNFKGNLGAQEGLVQGGVSRSVMEYLGRGYRHLDQIGEYDLMAISYGYTGVIPTHRDWFCTDEDVADVSNTENSAECSRDDATQDPFSYFVMRLNRGVGLLVGQGHSQEPAWTLADMKGQMDLAFVGLGSYTSSASATAKAWLNFFGKPGRPSVAEGVRDYVVGQLKSSLCNPELEAEINQKSTEEAKTKARNNLNDLRQEAARILKAVYSPIDLSC